MELKLRCCNLVIISVSSNRTFMELKYTPSGSADMTSGCSNRTFMELKYENVKMNII